MTRYTEPYRIPCPECNPPLTKDTADIADLRDLALVVDTVVEEIAVQADNVLISPDTGIMLNTGTQISSALDNILAFNSQEMDNSATGDLVQIAQSRFQAQQTGFYMITVGAFMTMGLGGPLRPGLAVDVNGIVSTGKGQTVASTTITGGLGVHDTRFLSAGDIVRFRWIADTNLSVTLSNHRAAISRLA